LVDFNIFLPARHVA